MEIDVQQYDHIARSLFAPVYPLIADSYAILHGDDIGQWVVMRK